jgi:hypothetical protein
LEIEIDWLAMENPGWDLLLSAYGDMVRGKNKSEGGYLPRIPAARLGIGFEIQAEKFSFGMDLNNVSSRTKLPFMKKEEDRRGEDMTTVKPLPLLIHCLMHMRSYDSILENHRANYLSRGTI